MSKTKLYKKLSQLECVKEEDANVLGLKFYRLWAYAYDNYLMENGLLHTLGRMKAFYNMRIKGVQ